jgi:hypothetical protein
MQSPEHEEALDDVLWGAEPIAAFIKRDIRQTYYLLQSKKLPAKKLGHLWISSKRKIRACLLGEDEAAR